MESNAARCRADPPIVRLFTLAVEVMTVLSPIPTGAREAVLVVGHRGNAAYAPENTLVSYRQADELGADLAECDVRLTADGQVVLMHDGAVDRTTDGTGNLSDTTLADVRKLDAGSWKGAEYAGERVPTLAQLLAPAQRLRLQIVIEIKAPGAAQRVVDVIRARRAVERCVVISFDRDTANAAKRIEPGLPCLWLMGDVPMTLAEQRELVHLAVADGLSGLNVAHHAVTSDFARIAHSRGLALWAWTANEPTDWQRLADIGVDAITTDRPGELRRWRLGEP